MPYNNVFICQKKQNIISDNWFFITLILSAILLFPEIAFAHGEFVIVILASWGLLAAISLIALAFLKIEKKIKFILGSLFIFTIVILLITPSPIIIPLPDGIMQMWENIILSQPLLSSLIYYIISLIPCLIVYLFIKKKRNI